MADKFGVSQSSYGRWEVSSEPNLDTIIGLAEFFKVPVGDLIAKEMELKDVPPRWGGREYPKQAEAAPPAVEEPGEDALMAKVLEKMEELEREHRLIMEKIVALENKG